MLGKEPVVETQTDLAVEINSLALVDTHEHLLTEDQWAGDNAKLIERMTEAGQPGWGDPNPDILQDLFMNTRPIVEERAAKAGFVQAPALLGGHASDVVLGRR